MTSFVPSFSTQQLLPPWDSVRCVRWGFVVKLSETAIQHYLDKYLNGNFADSDTRSDCAPFKYSPLRNLTKDGEQYGMVIFAYHPRMTSEHSDQNLDPGLVNRPGSDPLSCNEVFFMMPAQRVRIDENNKPVETATVWLAPFSFCDNATVVFGSREIWGSDKVYADVKLSAPAPGELHIDVAIEGFQKFEPTARSETLGCIHVHKDSGDVKTLRQVLDDKPELNDFAKLLMHKEDVVGDGWADGVTQTSSPAQIEFNNLKQFRDASRVDLAIYRAIVASSATHGNVDDLVFYEGSGIEVDVMWSASVREILESLFGIKDPGKADPPVKHSRPAQTHGAGHDVNWKLPRSNLTVEAAFAFTSDVRFEVMSTLYAYTG